MPKKKWSYSKIYMKGSVHYHRCFLANNNSTIQQVFHQGIGINRILFVSMPFLIVPIRAGYFQQNQDMICILIQRPLYNRYQYMHIFWKPLTKFQQAFFYDQKVQGKGLYDSTPEDT